MTTRALDRRTLARRISAVENRLPGSDAILREAYGDPGSARVIGITGPPGAGKSTLVDALAAAWAARGEAVAILAVDPSSPYSGGALLGDRIRMDRSAAYQSIYFRSLSSRGQVGGVSGTTADIIPVLGHARFTRILIETVGAGQADIEVMNLADCVLVVSVPGLGDQVQASKAGLMEIGDVYAVNKGDRPAARSTLAEIDRALATRYMGQSGVNQWAHGATGASAVRLLQGVEALNARHGDPGSESSTWRPPVLETVATTGAGTVAVVDSTEAFLQWAHSTSRIQRNRHEHVRQQLLRLLTARLIEPFVTASDGDSPLDLCVRRIVAGHASPHEMAQQLVAPALQDLRLAAGSMAKAQSGAGTGGL